MPFLPSITQLSSGNTVKSFTELSTGILLNADPVKRRMLLSTQATIAKNAIYTFTVPTDLNVIAALPIISGTATSASLKLEVTNTAGTKLFAGTFTYAAVSGYVPFWDSLLVARDSRLSIIPSEAIDRLTFLAEEVFIDRVSI
jgi:hypothetical protein